MNTKHVWMLTLALVAPSLCAVPANAQAPDAPTEVRPAVVLPAAPLAREATMADVLSGKLLPQTISLKDLNPSFWRVAFSMVNPSANSTLALITGMPGQGGDVIYTRGDVVSVGGEQFLVSYKLNARLPGIMELTQPARRGKPLTPKVTAESTLGLTLHNMRQVSSFGEMRPFNLEKDIRELSAGPVGFAPPPGEEGHDPENQPKNPAQEASAENLGKVWLAVQQYSQDYGKLPPLTNANTARKYLAPYLANTNLLKQPGTEALFTPNDKLSNLREAQIEKAEEVVLFYDAQAAKDGSRHVLFARGQVRLVSAAEFEKLRMEPTLPLGQG